MKAKKPKKRATKYEKKLAVDLSFEDLVKLSVAPSNKGALPTKGKKR